MLSFAIKAAMMAYLLMFTLDKSALASRSTLDTACPCRGGTPAWTIQ